MNEFYSEDHSNFSRTQRPSGSNSARSHVQSELEVAADLARNGYDPTKPHDPDSIFDLQITIKNVHPFWGCHMNIQIKSCYGNIVDVPLWTRGVESEDRKATMVSSGENSKKRNTRSYYAAGMHLIAVATDSGVYYYDVLKIGSNVGKFNWKKEDPVILDDYIERMKKRFPFISGDVAELADASDLKSDEG